MKTKQRDKGDSSVARRAFASSLNCALLKGTAASSREFLGRAQCSALGAFGTRWGREDAKERGGS